ncbi:MAG: RedY protein [bacterium]
MVTIVDKIRLKPGVDPERFERWVRDSDYASCPALPSLVSFAVARATVDSGAPFHYFEIIQVTSAEAFEADMASDTFRALVAAFADMADVVETFRGRRLEPGYTGAT